MSTLAGEIWLQRHGIGRVLAGIGGHWKAAGGVGWRALVGHWFRFFEGIGRALVGIGGHWWALEGSRWRCGDVRVL